MDRRHHRNLITLNGTQSVPGPNDFEYGVSWDETVLGGQDFNVTLCTTVLEPTGSILTTAALLTLAGLRRRALLGVALAVGSRATRCK